jgi:fibronectin type 3 domain-containing protein
VDCNFWYQGKGSGTVSTTNGKPSQVTGLAVTETKETSLGLKWTAVDNAQKYTVEGTSSGGSYSTLATPVGNTCKVSGLNPGTTYTIRVKAVNTKGTGTASAAIKVTTKGTAQSQNRTDLAAPELVSASCSLGGVKVKWKAVEGAQLYRVLRKSEGSDWTGVQETTKLSWLDTTAQSGTAYTYSVRCINASDKSDAGSMDETGLGVTYCAAPAVKKAEVTAEGVKVSWDKVTGAGQYRLFRKVGDGKWEKVADTGDTSFTDTAAKAGKVYRYTVRCISEDAASYISSYDASGVEQCVLRAPKLSSVKSSKKKTITAAWAKVSGAGGYQVRCVLGSTTKKKDFSGGSKTSGTVGSLKKKKTYTVSVRAWKKVNGTTWYSGWSSKKKVKVKK